MILNIPELLRFFDEKPPDSIGHASAIVSVIGEDIGVALLQRCLKEQRGENTKVITQGGRPLIPKTGTVRGPRLDRWLFCDPKPHEETTLYQVEIKNWSAHAIGGREIPGNMGSEEFLKQYRLESWRQMFAKECFRHTECGKVLIRMKTPTQMVNENGQLVSIQQPIRVEPVICFWWPIHRDGKDESLFSYRLSAVPESGFDSVWVFSMSNYLRSLVGRVQEIELDLPSAAQRIEWLRRLLR
jgi:hypothetical protein